MVQNEANMSKKHRPKQNEQIKKFKLIQDSKKFIKSPHTQNTYKHKEISRRLI